MNYWKVYDSLIARAECREFSARVYYGKPYSDEVKKHLSDKQVGVGNSNAKYWQIQFPGVSVNTVRRLKSFCKEIGISLYSMRNRKSIGYVLIGEKV
jgi:hypothetical protein